MLASFWSVRFLSSPYTSSEGNWNTFLQCLGTLNEETGLLDYTGDAYPIWGALQYLKVGGLSGAHKSNLLQPMQIERFLDFISKTAHVFASFFPLLCFLSPYIYWDNNEALPSSEFVCLSLYTVLCPFYHNRNQVFLGSFQNKKVILASFDFVLPCPW